MSNQPQDNSKAGWGEETPVLFIRKLPYLPQRSLAILFSAIWPFFFHISTYLTESIRWEASLREKGNGDFTGNDTKIGGIRSLKELIEDALFLGREIKIRVLLC